MCSIGRQLRAQFAVVRPLICCSNTTNEVKNSVDSLQRLMQRSYQEILARVRGLEKERPDSLTQDATKSTRSDIEEHNGSISDISRDGTATQTSTSKSGRIFNRIFERDLAVTRAYQRIKWRGSITSTFTNENPATRWSTVSDLSVADVISTLSVYELAITPSEIFQSQQYTTRAEYMPERASTDSLDEGAFSTMRTIPEFTEEAYPNFEEAYPDFPEATDFECFWRSQKHVPPELTDALIGDSIPKTLLPRRSGEGLDTWLYQINEL